jgi:hypothetical protein
MAVVTVLQIKISNTEVSGWYQPPLEEKTNQTGTVDDNVIDKKPTTWRRLNKN